MGKIDENIKKGDTHAHIHSFDLDSFEFLKIAGYQVLSKNIVSKLLRIISCTLTEGVPVVYNEKMKYPKILVDIYNAFLPILKRLFGKNTTIFLIRLDDFICRFIRSYDGILYIILKDGSCCLKKANSKVSIYQIIDIAVPYYYLK